MPADEKRPLIIGIAGGTGSGKSTVAANLSAGLAEGSAVVVDHDAYYRHHPEMPIDKRAALNYDHPDALDNEMLLRHLDRLRAGAPVEVPIYDFVHHLRKTETRHVLPAPVVFVEGILVFVDEHLRARLDIKIFVDTPPDVRVLRRIKRDLRERGRDFDSIRRQYYETVRPMHLEFVEPSKQFADLIIPEGHGGNLDIALDVIVERMRRAAR